MTDVEHLTERLVARLSRLGAERQLSELDHLKRIAESYGVDFQRKDSGSGLLAMQALLTSRIRTAQSHNRRPKALSPEQVRVAASAIVQALAETGHLHNGSLPL